MVSTFMIYAFAASLVLGVAALAAEHALRKFEWQARWAWVAATSLSVLLPAVFLVAPQVAWDPARALGGSAAEAMWAATGPILEYGERAWWLEASLRLGWVILTGLGLGFVVVSALRLRVVRRGWTQATMAGQRVLLSEDMGPAAFGVRGGEIVMPRWAFDADARLQRLMLAHEQEHLRAGDPLLTVLVVVAMVAMPWNPALWWMARRLRAAIEVDCDQRVLRAARSDVGTYGSLLLEVGRRASRHPLPATSFSRPGALLERRIRAMTTVSPRQGRLVTATGAVGIVLSAVTFVLVTPHPILGFCSTAPAPGEVKVAAKDGPSVVIGVHASAPRVIRYLPPAAGG